MERRPSSWKQANSILRQIPVSAIDLHRLEQGILIERQNETELLKYGGRSSYALRSIFPQQDKATKSLQATLLNFVECNPMP